MKQAFDAFTAHLKDNNQVMTPQRRIIFQLFLDAPPHVSAKEMLKRVQAVDPEIGQATVYRTMRLLAASGVARELKFDDGVSRYEFDHGKEHHDHIICTRCRKSVEVLDPRIEKLQELLAEMHGFRMTNHKMVLYGICERCRAKTTPQGGDKVSAHRGRDRSSGAEASA